MNIINGEKSLPLPPGKFGLPVIGETLGFLQDPDFANKRQQKYGTIFKTRLFGNPTVFMIGFEANRFLLTNENNYFSIAWPDSTRILLGPASLAIQTGSIHQKRRKLLAQAFQPRALAGYTPKMAEITQNYLHKWESMGNLTWYPELRKYTFDVACKLLIGTDTTSDRQLVELFEEWCEGLFSLPISLPWTKFGKALRCRQQLLAKIEELIQQRQQQPSSDEDALGILLQAEDEEGNSLSLQELKDQVLLLLFAGHETLTSAIASFCLLLAQNPQILADARAEQQQLGINAPLSIENLHQMTYLDQILKEVLRVIPPVGGGFRKVIKSCEFNGYLIPEGWSIIYQIGGTHQDTNVYTHPQSFNPQRFDQQTAENKSKPFSYVPFGGGVRECLGREFAKLEMKLFAALLLRGYEWELLPGQNLDLVRIPTPHPQDGLQVKFRHL